MAKLRLPKGKNKSPEYGQQKNLYSYLQAIYMSFYSVDIYVDVRHRWRGVGALYVLLVMSIVTLPGAIKLGYTTYEYYHQVLVPTLKKVPILEINKGELTFDKPQPFFINSPKANSTLVIIDTTGKIKNLPNANYPQVSLLLTKYAMISQFGNIPPMIEKYDKNLTAKVKPMMLLPIFERLKDVFLYSLYPSMVMMWFGIAIGFFGVFAFILKMFSVILMKYELSYKLALRLACVSSTPMILGFAICTFWQMQGGAVGTFLLMVWLGYFIFAVRSNKYAAKHPKIISS